MERGRTPGSETRVPVVMCPRTSLPPVERLPEPMGSWGLRLGGCGVLGVEWEGYLLRFVL